MKLLLDLLILSLIVYFLEASYLIGYVVVNEGSVEPTLRGFISTLNAKKSYRPYLNEDEGFGLYIWIDLSKKPFYKWPYLLDYAEESDRKDIEREHKTRNYSEVFFFDFLVGQS